jgi:hypothetical protein
VDKKSGGWRLSMACIYVISKTGPFMPAIDRAAAVADDLRTDVI